MEAQRVYRVCGTPVRTGCFTCKKRHIKCDEQKPACKRCIKSRRTCEGYLPSSITNHSSETTAASTPALATAPSGCSTLTSISTSATVSTNPSSSSSTPFETIGGPVPAPAPWHSLSLISALSPAEAQALALFKTRTAPGLAGYSTSTFFTSRILHLCITEPVIQHAAISLSAIHQLFLTNQLDATGNNASSPEFYFALSQNIKAIQHLKELMSRPVKNQKMDVLLTACILFVVFDSFLGNYLSAMIHLRCGLQILRDIKGLDTYLSKSWVAEFSPLIMRLGVQAMTFLHPRSDEDRIGLWGELKIASLPPSPTNPIVVLKNVEEAQWRLNTIGAELLWDFDTTPIEGRLGIYLKHTAALAAWDEGLKELLSGLDTTCLEPATEAILRAACLLKAYQNLISLVLNAFEDKENTKFEEILALAVIVDRGEMVYGLPKSTRTLNFSSDLGVVALWFFAAMKCKDLSIRRRAWRKLGEMNRREGMWDAGLCALVVGRVFDAMEGDEEADVVKEMTVTWEACALHKELELRQKLRMK